MKKSRLPSRILLTAIFLLLLTIAALLVCLRWKAHNDGKTSGPEVPGSLQEEEIRPSETGGEINVSGGETDPQSSPSKDQESETDDAEEPAESSEIEDQVLLKAKEMLSSMTLEEKIWQMMILTPDQLTDGTESTFADDAFASYLEKRPVGGLLYFHANLTGPDQTKEMTAKTLQYGLQVEGLPLFLCIDEEGGQVARLANHEAFDIENVGPMGNVTSMEEAYDAGNTIGAYLSEYGFNFDLAPDADVLTDADNTVIGDRSFGADPGLVSDYAASFSRGLKDNGVLSCYKHFPGHGGVSGDTHSGFVENDKTLEEFLDSEMIPFANAEENGIDCIMVAHIAVPGITGSDCPSSLSGKMITEILRGRLGFTGLVMTDALNMQAVLDYCGTEDPCVLAIEAGADLLLEPVDPEASFAAVFKAVEEERISEERLDESVLRILAEKCRMEK